MSAYPDDPWWTQAKCAGLNPNLFFPQREGHHPQIRICHTCPVQQPCIQYALQDGGPGHWGGTTQQTRRQARRQPCSRCGQRLTLGQQATLLTQHKPQWLCTTCAKEG